MEDSGCGPVRLGDGFGSCILGGCFSKAHHQQSVLGTGWGQGVCVAGGVGMRGGEGKKMGDSCSGTREAVAWSPPTPR